MLHSIACRTEHFFSPWYNEALLASGIARAEAERHLHRKMWEWVSIYRALDERGCLRPEKRGLGFAVGREPLAGIFANRGTRILATDVGEDGDLSVGWIETGQHAASKAAMFDERVHDRKLFEKNVYFEAVDMKDLSGLRDGAFDFLWSACSIEHLGTLAAGTDFVLKSTKLLRPGGVAVHTTEFNISSNEETIEEGNTVIYRERDLRQLDRDLRKIGAGLEPLDLYGGTHEHDLKFDYFPYHAEGRTHIKLKIGDYICTSVLLIIQN